jgi:hypothetical protein
MNKLNDKTLIQLSTQFRYGVIGRKSSSKECYKVAAPLCAYFKFLKVECSLIEGYVTIGEAITNHYWLALPDGRILDPTADQFNEVKKQNMPKVYLGEKPQWYMEKKSKKQKRISNLGA